MEIEGQGHPCLSLISNDDGTLRNEHYTKVTDGLSLCFESNILHTIKPTVTLCIEVEGTGSSIVGITNGETIIPLYSLQFQHHSSVMFILYLKENRQEVKATFNDETSKISVDQEQGVKLDLKIFGGNFIISLTQNGKTVMKLNTDASETHRIDAKNETNVSDLDNAKEKKAKQTDDDKDDELVDTKEEAEHINALNPPVIQCSPQPINEDTSVSTIGAETCIDNNANKFKTDKNKINTEEQIEESREPSNNKDSELIEGGNFQTENMHKGSTRMDKIETVDIRTHRVELLTRMNARRLVNYFYQSKLISEEDMEEINEPEGRRKANERLLKILRDRNISRQNISEVLTRAEEDHLLDYMFPNEIKAKSVSTQTENNLEDGNMCLLSRSAL